MELSGGPRLPAARLPRMCGIAGLVEREASVPIAKLRKMAEAQAHRGPHDMAIAAWGRAGFSFRRLAIVDVRGGAQPLSDESGRIHVVANAEIYNHTDLRRQLEGRGHRFRTASDVEAIVHGYEEWGEGVVERLAGMFALAIWDEDRQRLLLARDRLGKKPLLYSEAGGRLAFASEFRALLVDSRIPRDPDPRAISDYLTYQYVPAPSTGFKAVRKLPAAHTLVFENGAGRLERYWSPSTTPRISITPGEALEETERRLEAAVEARRMGEVPTGAFLSGGVDSSLVAAMMARTGRVRTFSVGFEDPRFSELPFARAVAQHLGTEHHEFVLKAENISVLPQLVRHYGEPYADSSALPSFFLSRRSMRPSKHQGMPVWQDKLFITMARNANDASSYFRLPPGRVIEVGSQVTV